jgi:hypothetical protein
MTQTLYAHMNKIKIKKIEKEDTSQKLVSSPPLKILKQRLDTLCTGML